MTTLLENLSLGLSVATSPQNLLLCLVGVVLGTLLGIIPGIGPLVALSLLFPFTFHLDPTGALIMLAGIFYGTAYGGSIASILLNLPGTPANAVACLDGYPMAKQGRAGIALAMTTIGSFVGASIGVLMMILLSPTIAAAALSFGPWEFFAIMLLGLIIGSTMTGGAPLKALAMSVLGIMLGAVGTDTSTGAARFTFGSSHLLDGLGLAAVAMGTFGVAELIHSIRGNDANSPTSVSLRSMIPSRDDFRRSWLPMIRGSAVGAVAGALPGLGGMIASFMAYALERKVAKDPSRFGKGAIEGVTAPEAANNAADQTAFIPTMTLGIPGSASMAIMLGVLMIHGITPGPLLINNEPGIFWGLIMSFWIGNVLLVILNIPLIGVWVRFLSIPFHIMYPAVIMFICMGTYSVNHSITDIYIVLALGLAGYGMRLLDLPPAPLLLGFVLGPMIEENFVRAMRITGGDPFAFILRPVSGTIFAILAILVVWMIVSRVRGPRLVRTSEADNTAGTVNLD